MGLILAPAAFHHKPTAPAPVQITAASVQSDETRSKPLAITGLASFAYLLNRQ